MVGAAGISAFPMSAGIVQRMAKKEDPTNFILMQAVGANVAGHGFDSRWRYGACSCSVVIVFVRRNIMSDISLGLQLMQYGLAGVFLVLILFYVLITLLVKFSLIVRKMTKIDVKGSAKYN